MDELRELRRLIFHIELLVYPRAPGYIVEHHGAAGSMADYGRPRPQDHLPRRSGPLRRHALVWFGGPFLLIGKAGLSFLGPTKLHFTKLGVADTSENLGQPLVSFVLNKNSIKQLFIGQKNI